ncbi:hypothetical protein [Falsiroseomonas sp. HW251]|uniref:hypothetical protein n=1 Tax=Falsiroseomonas sp. HW251 TaxID=3390998 RepID=UPI003D31B482
MVATTNEQAGPRTDGPEPPPAAAAGRPAVGFALRDFLSDDDQRLRDLLAFGMAVQAGRPLGTDGVPDFRRKAEAELDAHAFRVLHNQAEAIRRQAVDDHLARFPRGLSFWGVVLANLASLVVALALIAVVWIAAPDVFGKLHAYLAQLAARFHAGS